MTIDEGIATLARVAEAKERLRKQANPKPVEIPERPIAEEETMAAGVKRGRVLSLADKLHRLGALSFEKHGAATILRNQIMAELPPSEGISSYGGNVKASEPSRKADRIGRRHTGYDVQQDGTIRWAGGKRSMRNLRSLEDAIFAAVGLHDEEGRRVVNIKHAEILMRVVLESENLPTLKDLTQELTSYYGKEAKQGPPYSVGVIDTWLGRLSQHYRLAK